MKTPKSIGRPPRAEASATALETLLLNGIDVESVSPLTILRSIASDLSAPPAARVRACEVLLHEARLAPPAANGPADDPLTRRALEILNKRTTLQ